MSGTLIAQARPAALRICPASFLAAGLTVLVAAVGLACAGDDPVAPGKPSAAREAPMVFGDPAVQRGAHGGKSNLFRIKDGRSLPVFRDPSVRKGTGGR
jgi:hypothetical protein